MMTVIAAVIFALACFCTGLVVGVAWGREGMRRRMRTILDWFEEETDEKN